MSDANTLQHDQTLDVLRQRETDLATDCRAHEIEGRILAGRLQELRDLIALCNRKPRSARKPRVTEGPQPISKGIEDALNRLGSAVRAQSDFEALGAGPASDTRRAHDTDLAEAA